MLKMNKTGLAFSGGGIRSAAFSSGVLRRLLQRETKIDYLSCVSGGGYTGSAYVDWKYRNGNIDDPRWHQEFFAHMRERSGLMCNWQKPLQGVVDTLIILLLILFVCVVMPLILWGSYVFPVAYVIDLLFGNLLREEFHCPDPPTTSLPLNNTLPVPQGIRRPRCQVETGTKSYYRVVLFSVSAAMFVVFYILAKTLPKHHHGLYLVSTLFGLLFSFTFIPYCIHFLFQGTPVWVQLLVLVFSLAVWIFFPVLRRRSSFVVVVYLYSYIVYWKVFKGYIFFVIFVKYSDYLFFRLMFAFGFVLWIAPALGALQQRLVYLFNRWRLQRAFYTPESVGKWGCRGIGCEDIFLTKCKGAEHKQLGHDESGPLTLGDLGPDMKPQYMSNVVVNEWSLDEDEKQRYELLVMSPTEIERLDYRKCQVAKAKRNYNTTGEHLDSREGQGQFEGKLELKHVKLSAAMATSAAAVARNVGADEDSTRNSNTAGEHLDSREGQGQFEGKLEPKHVEPSAAMETSAAAVARKRNSNTAGGHLDSREGQGQFEGKLEPKDVKLSAAMATSAAAVARNVGAYEDSTMGFKQLQVVLGLGMDSSWVSDAESLRKRDCCWKILPFVIEVLRVLPLVTFPLVYFMKGERADDEMWVEIGVLSFFILLGALTIFSVLRTGSENPGTLERLTRWFVVNVPVVRYMRQLLSVTNRGPTPPPILLLSDGGHIENLGILPLLKKRLSKIVVVDGGLKTDDSDWGKDLLHAFSLAREKLHCSFIGLDGRDVIEDIKEEFVNTADGSKLRSYRCKVHYYKEKNEKETEEKNEKESEEKNGKESEEKNGKESEEKNGKESEEKNGKESEEKNGKESEEKMEKETEEKNEKESEEKNGKESEEKKEKESEEKKEKKSEEGGKKVDEGEILLLAPRHPKKGEKHIMTWREALRDINVDLEKGEWGTGPQQNEEEVDNLTCCCCEFCHRSWLQYLSPDCLCGVFPRHSTANQFFTPRMFTAYHCEGYNACLEAKAAEFLGARQDLEMASPTDDTNGAQ